MVLLLALGLAVVLIVLERFTSIRGRSKKRARSHGAKAAGNRGPITPAITVCSKSMPYTRHAYGEISIRYSIPPSTSLSPIASGATQDGSHGRVNLEMVGGNDETSPSTHQRRPDRGRAIVSETFRFVLAAGEKQPMEVDPNSYITVQELYVVKLERRLKVAEDALRAQAVNDQNALLVARGIIAFLKSAVMCGEQLTLSGEEGVDEALMVVDNQIAALNAIAPQEQQA